MPLNLPSLSQIRSRVEADIAAQLPNANPRVRGSIFRAMILSFALRVNAVGVLLRQAVDEAFPQTATGEQLERFAAVSGLTRNPASKASGQIVFQGSPGSIVPLQSLVNGPGGEEYRTLASVTMADQSISVTSLSSSAGIATAVVAGHSFATGQDVAISGAADAEYNGSFRVTVQDDGTVTYEVDGTPNSPTSGTIVASSTGAVADIRAEFEGVDGNLTSGAQLSLASTIAGVQATALVRFDGVTGGTNVEDDTSLRARILESRSGIKANFSPEAITDRAKAISGVTRVLVRRATPAAGDVTVHFVRDGDANIIPSSLDVQEVRASLLEILPATSDEAALIVAAPSPVSVNFAFTAINPNNESMQAAIRASLTAFFEDGVEIGNSIESDAFRSAILNTVTENDALISFALSTPSSTVAINADEIGILGAVTFA